MKQITTSCLGIEVPVTGIPEFVEGDGQGGFSEAIKVFGSAQAVIDAAVSYVRLHRTNAEVRSDLVDRIEQVTGVKRTTKSVKSPTKAEPNRMVDEYDESEADYAKRALATSGLTIADLGQQVLAGGFEIEGKTVEPLTVEFSAQGTPRTGAGRQQAKVYIKAAEQLIALGEAQYNASIATLEQANSLTVERDEAGAPKVDSLANALKANRERVLKEANAAIGLPAAA